MKELLQEVKFLLSFCQRKRLKCYLVLEMYFRLLGFIIGRRIILKMSFFRLVIMCTRRKRKVISIKVEIFENLIFFFCFFFCFFFIFWMLLEGFCGRFGGSSLLGMAFLGEACRGF